MMKILLVDDDDLVRSAIVEVLRDAGYEVVETADPHEALGLPSAIGSPGLVITDIDLQSTLNGFDVAAVAHRLWSTVRVILISGLSAEHTGQILDPRDRYLQKPFSQSGLLGAIEELVHAA
jgi:DNA-binding response OmpR family regulator